MKNYVGQFPAEIGNPCIFRELSNIFCVVAHVFQTRKPTVFSVGGFPAVDGSLSRGGTLNLLMEVQLVSLSFGYACRSLRLG